MNKIVNSTSISEIRAQLSEMKKLLRDKKLLQSLGFTPVQKAKLASDVRKFERTFESLSTLPDKFNEAFKEKGWIAYESLSVEIMEETIKLAADKGTENAEGFLVNFYTDREKISYLCNKTKRNLGVRATLFEVALNDHFDKRYYSSTPLFFMIIDGFVNEEEATGFFAERTDLIAWDSVVGHETGLNEISKLMSKTRRKTNVEEIKVPYRNGILHGRDLNYANPFISSKLLAVIFSLMDWKQAKNKMKSGETKEVYTPPTLEETFSSLSKTFVAKERLDQQKVLIDAWKKREIEVGVTVPINGKVDEFEEGTPERCLIEVFKFINDSNYGHLVDRIFYDSRQITKGKKAGELKGLLKCIQISSFEILEIVDESPAITVIGVQIDLKVNDKISVREEKFRLIYSDNEQNPYARGTEEGSWRVIDNFTPNWELLQLGIR
ncbi:hypothetical protein [Sporosarcina koreensis]|uniref:hypothetical protein n=1 Tax=Sporosarcina koreensis TaxID=334735 RepID=UPI000759525B|nr:hypothetical protein [Sporosarcina koreensis]